MQQELRPCRFVLHSYMYLFIDFKPQLLFRFLLGRFDYSFSNHSYRRSKSSYYPLSVEYCSEKKKRSTKSQKN